MNLVAADVRPLIFPTRGGRADSRRLLRLKGCAAIVLALSTVVSSAQFSLINIGRNPIGTMVTNAPGSYTLVGGGNDTWDNFDELTFACEEVCGDFDVKVRVDDLQLTSRWSKAGIMVRESLAEDSRMVFHRVTPPPVPTDAGGLGANDVQLAYRTGTFNNRIVNP